MSRRRREEPEPVEITYDDIVHETQPGDPEHGALLLVIPTYGDNTTEAWVPKSQISDHDEERRTMVIPEWLATEKGLT